MKFAQTDTDTDTRYTFSDMTADSVRDIYFALREYEDNLESDIKRLSETPIDQVTSAVAKGRKRHPNNLHYAELEEAAWLHTQLGRIKTLRLELFYEFGDDLSFD